MSKMIVKNDILLQIYTNDSNDIKNELHLDMMQLGTDG